MKLGFARVSTQQQHIDRQIKYLEDMGVEKIYKEKISGIKKNRPALDELKNQVRKGDELYIESISRLGRSSKDLLELIEYFTDKGVKIISEKEGVIDIKTTMGKLVVQIISAIAEMERNIISDRTKDGLERARARGNFGGKPKIKQSKIDTALKMYDSKEYTIKEICDTVEITHGTLYKYIKLENEKEVVT